MNASTATLEKEKGRMPKKIRPKKFSALLFSELGLACSAVD